MGSVVKVTVGSLVGAWFGGIEGIALGANMALGIAVGCKDDG